MNKIIAPVAYFKGDFPDKFGLPRQSGMTDLTSEIVFLPEFSQEEGFRGLEGFDYLWVIWGFDRSSEKRSLTVRPPRLGGNERMGVFATRAPFRPNGLGLSSVKLIKIKRDSNNVALVVRGADLADGTPIYDVKPYLPFTDSHPEARGGFSEEKLDYKIKVNFPDALKKCLPQDKIDGLISALELDPRPAYRDDEKVYGFGFCGKEIKFFVKNDVLTVISVE